MRITRRHLQVSLAVLWLIDGALQCQPIMFSRDLTHRIIAPADAQLSVVAGPLHLMGAFVSAHPALANSGFVLIQIALGVGLLSRRFTRVALGASIAWSLVIWIVGEGLGGLASGATLLNGAPGAALLYAVIAFLSWPTTSDKLGDARPSWLALPAWCALWLTGAGLQLVAAHNSASSLAMMLRGAQSGSPGWIAEIDQHLIRLRMPTWTAAGLIAVYVLVAIWALVPGWTFQLSVGIGVFIALSNWLLFQGLGDLTSGQATDPNSGPLIVLLALAVLGSAYPREIGAPSLAVMTDAEACAEKLARHRHTALERNVLDLARYAERPVNGSLMR